MGLSRDGSALAGGSVTVFSLDRKGIGLCRARLRKEGGRQVLCSGRVLLPPGAVEFHPDRAVIDPQAVKEGLESLLRRFSLKNPKAVVVLPRLYLVDKKFALPAMPSALLKQAAASELARLLPWPLEETWWSCSLREAPPGNQPGPVQAAAAAPVSLLAPWVQAFAAGGVAVEGFVSSTSALVQVWRETGRTPADMTPDEGEALIFSGDGPTWEMAMVRGEDQAGPLFARSGWWGEETAREGGPSAQAVAEEAARSLRFARRQGEDGEMAVWLPAAWGMDLAEKVQEVLTEEDRAVTVRQWPTVPLPGGVQAEPLAYGAAAALLRDSSEMLTPGGSRSASRRISRGAEAVILGAISLVFLAGGLELNLLRTQRDLEALGARAGNEQGLAGAKLMFQEAGRLRLEETALKAVAGNTRSPLPLLAELDRCLPEDAWVEAVVVEGNRLMELRGQCISATRVMARLRESRVLTDLRFGAPITVVRGDGDGPKVEHFQITGRITGSGERGETGAASE